MIVWTGCGILIAVVAAMAGAFGASFAPGLEHLVLSPEQHVSNALDMALGCAAAAGGCFLLGLWLNKRERDSERVLVDPATGEALRFVRTDTLYHLRAATWGYILLAASALGLAEFLFETLLR